MKSNSENCEKCPKRWQRFFTAWFWGAIALIIAGVFLTFICNDESVVAPWTTILSLLSELCKTLGIALFLGTIFNFTIDSKGFMDYITQLLSEIVISKTFLNKLEKADKRHALELILQPSGDQLQQHTNINDYFQKKIDDSMEMFDTNFKTNLVLILKAFKEDGRVKVSGSLTNRIYKVKNRYEPIQTVFEYTNTDILSTEILYPQGKTPVNKEKYEQTTREEAGVSYKVFSFEIPEELYQHPYLTIQKEIFELGHDHWTNFHWTSLTPCDGIHFEMSCQDGLMIQDHLVFDEKSRYNVTLLPDRTHIKIVSTSWLDAYTGFTMTISDTPIEDEQAGVSPDAS